ncbi:Inner membrane protein CreD [hydrothermal vent metagenome]|uniref:Inner membrane protein CreD n=1 Tax=hydrothermal vent metagenome TaxID=652676 RepID=A0A3B0XEN3_9ZZZZ
MASLIKSLKQSSSIKLITIIFITLTMLIPVSMVKSTIFERSQLRHQAESSISDRWGSSQQISAPVLVLPYKKKILEDISTQNGWLNPNNKQPAKKISYVNHIAYLLADKVNINTKMTTETRYLGIYEMPVYVSKISITGNFSQKDFKKLDKQYPNIDWEQATLMLPVEDVRGIKSISKLAIAQKKADFIPASHHLFSISGIEAGINLLDKTHADVHFSFDFSLSGSQQLSYLPLARTSHISLISDWSSPSFTGSYLPTKREITDSGFSASWTILGLNRSFGQMWTDNTVDEGKIVQSAFGMSLYQPADVYQQNTRSVKYAALFIALTFMAFFLFEIFFGLNIHPMQYFFIGGSLSTFYLLLLAMSEHLHFSVAYLISSLAITLLMSTYSMTILKQKFRGMIIGLVTAVIYGFLYFLIQSEQNSLLFGAIGFFSALSTMMYLTRNIDWYNIKGQLAE